MKGLFANARRRISRDVADGKALGGWPLRPGCAGPRCARAALCYSRLAAGRRTHCAHLRLAPFRHAAPFQSLKRASTRAAARRCVARQRKGPSQPPAQGFANTAARARPSRHGRDSSGPGRQVRGPIGGAEPRSQTGLRIASGDASSAACLSTEHSWPPQADNGPQGCEGEFCASPGLGSSEGSLNAVKASASGAECLPAWAAARTHSHAASTFRSVPAHRRRTTKKTA